MCVTSVYAKLVLLHTKLFFLLILLFVIKVRNRTNIQRILVINKLFTAISLRVHF